MKICSSVTFVIDRQKLTLKLLLTVMNNQYGYVASAPEANKFLNSGRLYPMIKNELKNYLKAGYPAICVLTQETHRAEQLLPCEDWQFFVWDCIQGIRKAGSTQVIDEIRDPVEAISWLSMYTDTVLIANNLHLFLEIPEVIQAIQNGVIKWKGIGCALIMVSPVITLAPEIDKLFTVINLPLPDDNALIDLQKELYSGPQKLDTVLR